MDLPEIMTIQELSEFLNLRIDTIRRWSVQKKIPYLKIGSLIRYRREEILKLIDRHLVKPKGETNES